MSVQNPMTGTLFDAFERAAAPRLDREAVSSEHATLTFAELLDASKVWADALIHAGVQTGSVVAMFLPGSPEYTAALLATLKVGAVFLPVSIGTPSERIGRILDSAKPSAFVCRRSNAASVADLLARTRQDPDTPLLSLDWEPTAGNRRSLATLLSGKRCAQRQRPDLPGDACYILSTSGSTGTPKLILGSQLGLLHFIRWELSELRIDDTVRGTMLSAPTFDVSLRDIFVPLLAGGTVCIPDPETRTNGRSLLEWMRKARVSLAHMVPTVLRLLVGAGTDSDEQGSALPDMRYLLMAGEPLYGADVAAWRSLAGTRAELVNLYGPSETTLAKLFFRIGVSDFTPDEMIPLGRPIPDTEALIRHDGRICTAGETGELHIATRFSSHGYLGQPAETASAFDPSPPCPGQSVTTYRTGDLASRRVDGVIRFEGRCDQQVKVRGNRVELGEIEVALRGHVDCQRADNTDPLTST